MFGKLKAFFMRFYENLFGDKQYSKRVLDTGRKEEQVKQLLEHRENYHRPQLYEQNPLFLDVLLKQKRKGYTDEHIRSLYKLYGPILIDTSCLYAQLTQTEMSEEEAQHLAQEDYHFISGLVDEFDLDNLFPVFDNYAENHDYVHALSGNLSSASEPEGLKFLQALLAYEKKHSEQRPMDLSQKSLLEAIVGHMLHGLSSETDTEPSLLVSGPELFEKGHVLMKQGEIASDVLIVVDGELQVTAGDQDRGRRPAGSIVGEMATLFGGKRTATVHVCSKDARVLRLNAKQFKHLFRDRVFLLAYVEVVARRRNRAVIGFVEERKRQDESRLGAIAIDRELLERQRVAFETLVRKRHVQGFLGTVDLESEESLKLAKHYLQERLKLAKVLAWELGLDALAIQYSPDFEADFKLSGGRASALTRADTMGQLKVMDFVKAKFPDTDYVIGEESVGEELFDHEHQKKSNYRWIVDPIDGTRNYSEGGIEWGVHVYCEFRLGQDQWLPILDVKYSPKWNKYDDSKGGLMVSWCQGEDLVMNGKVFTLDDREQRVQRRRASTSDRDSAHKILCGSHPKVPFIAGLPNDMFHLQGKYNSGMIQSMEYDLGEIDLLSIGSPFNNRTQPHDAFVVFTALGFGGTIGVFDFELDENGKPLPAGGAKGTLAKTIVGDELVVHSFLRSVL